MDNYYTHQINAYTCKNEIQYHQGMYYTQYSLYCMYNIYTIGFIQVETKK